VIKNLGQMMKKAKEMQTKMAEAQARVAAIEATGVSGGGLVEVTLSGKNEMRRLSVDPSLASEEPAVLEDLIVAAHNDARIKIDALVQEEMAKVTGGLELPPGFEMPSF
jgi:DNA-binding YbaB/EbfC family protein